MYGKVACWAGFTALLIIWANGCAGDSKVTAPQVGTKFSTKLFDIYDPSMIYSPPIMAIPRPYGEGTFLLHSSGTRLSFDVSFSFFHEGDFAGAKFYLSPMFPSGQVVRTIQPSEVFGNRIRGVWKNADPEPLTPALVDSLIAGRIFIEVVAKDSTGLDIGQLLPAP